MNHGACNLDPNQSAFPWLPGHRRTVPGRYNGDERRPFLAGQRYQPSSRCLSPGKQMLGADLVPSRHLGNNRSREIGLRDDPALLFLGPTAPAPNASPDFYTATRPRTVKYIVDHICEPISPNRSTSADLSKSPQGAVKRPLTHKKKVCLNNFGLSNSRGSIEINYNPDDDGSSSLIEGRNIHDGLWEKVQVNVIKGDDYLTEREISSVDLLKVDVEGAEHLVFDGFSESFASSSISAVQFEFGMVNIYSKFLLRDFWELFSKHGFVIGPLMPRGVEFKEYNTRDEDFEGTPNFFAVHKTRTAMIDAVRLR